MLREFRRSDARAFFDLLRRHFPEEDELLRYRPDAFDEVVRRVFRPDVRLVLRLLNALRHPIIDFFVIEEDGRVAATAILTFTERAGYVSTVMVDTPFRRRGYAKRLLAACAAATRRAGRPYLVLDVLTTNEGALALYRSLGYAHVREVAYLVADLPAAPAPAVPCRSVRPMRRRDASALEAIAVGALPAPVARVLPVERKAFFVPPLVAMGLVSETQAWVIDRGHGAEGFLRATVSGATDSGHFSQPLLAPSVPADLAAELVATGVAWLRSNGKGRVVVEVPGHNTAGREALEGGGFHEAFALETLARSSDA